MIITRTPFRISFFGGGSDYPNWYEEHGGAVLNTTINKYCYIMLRYFPPFFKYKYQIRYRLSEHCSRRELIKHPVARECLKFMNINNGVELVHTADLPARSGVGSSSSFTVGCLHALNALQGNLITKRQLALDAIHIEQDLVKENVGSQDQTAAAFGGLNRIDFDDITNIMVTPITLKENIKNNFQNNLMLFFTGFSRTASEVAGTYIPNLPKKNKRELIIMHQMVYTAEQMLINNKLDDFGRLLNDAWKIKKTFSKNISNNIIDEIYSKALNSGALGGKLCGAGSGGFLLLYVPKEKQHIVKKSLRKLLYVPFIFDSLGSQIIMYNQPELYDL